MNDIDGMQVGLALRDRLANEHPDLEHLAAASLAAGLRVQRRRRLLAGAGTAAAIAGVTTLALSLGMLGGDDGDARGQDWAASSPTPSRGMQVGQKLDLGYGLTGTVHSIKDKASFYVLGESTRRGGGTGYLLVVHGPTDRINQWWSDGFGTATEDWPGITLAVSTPDAEALGMLGKTDQAPVAVPDGWTCEWMLADDKASCTSDDGGAAGLVIRDAKDRPAWAADPDKGDDPSVYTTEAHNGIFISVQGGQGTTDAEIQELGEGLTWK